MISSRSCNIVVKPIARGDLKAVYEVERKSFDYPYSLDTIRWLAQDSNSIFLIAQFDAQIVGYIAASQSGPRSHIISIAVIPEFQRRGIGTLMMRRLERFLAEDGTREVRLEVTETNHIARLFYEKHGYSMKGSLARYYPDGQDAITYMKNLF